MELYDLTNPQKSIWLMEQFYKGTAVNNICGTVLIHEPVNFSNLYKAVCTFVKSNNSFMIRLCFNERNEISQYFDDNFYCRNATCRFVVDDAAYGRGAFPNSLS